MKRVTLTIGIASAAAGILTLDPADRHWAAAAILLYSIPLLSVRSRLPLVRVYGAWLGVFLVLQLLASFYLISSPYHLPAHFSRTMDVEGDSMPGIHGIQVVKTDARGFRTTKPIAYDRIVPLRIFALGASTTEMIYVDNHRTWPALLEQQLEADLHRPVEVVNASVSGLRMPQIYRNFEAILRLHPTVALFLVGVNDWDQDIRGHFDPSVTFRQRFYQHIGLDAEDMQPWFLRNTYLGRAVVQLTSHKAPQPTGVVVERGDFYRTKLRAVDRPDVRAYHPAALEAEYRTYLSKTADACRRAGVTCVWITQPSGYKTGVDPILRARFWMTPPDASYTLDLESMNDIAAFYNDSLLASARSNQQPACDLNAAIAPTLDNFYDDVHFNEAGARRVAAFVSRCLEGLPALR